MRYDPNRRAAVMTWLAEQGVDVTTIPRLAKHSPTPEASEGESLPGSYGAEKLRQCEDG